MFPGNGNALFRDLIESDNQNRFEKSRAILYLTRHLGCLTLTRSRVGISQETLEATKKVAAEKAAADAKVAVLANVASSVCV